MTPDDRRTLYLTLEPAVFPGATPAQIADELDVSDQTVRNWRGGKSPVPLPVLWTLAGRRIALDARPFADVLADWLERNGLSLYAAAKVLEVDEKSLRNWKRSATTPATEKAMRALMGQVDAGKIG